MRYRKLDRVRLIISRDEARDQGLTHYFTGEPCNRGHVSDRMVSNWRCIRCLKIARNEYIANRRRTKPGSYAESDRKANERYRNSKAHWRSYRRAGQATPVWADREVIEKVYLDCPPDMTVDHIVAFKGRTVEGYRVSGLNVPWNLQYMSMVENNRKRTRMRPEDMPR
jgi:hypothetical protein